MYCVGVSLTLSLKVIDSSFSWLDPRFKIGCLYERLHTHRTNLNLFVSGGGVS